uniref:Uncharacterized protein n=1 Tax=Varanus komodoensis TaxID=61221 RepID=A0A8D2LZS0_VARKO
VFSQKKIYHLPNEEEVQAEGAGWRLKIDWQMVKDPLIGLNEFRSLGLNELYPIGIKERKTILVKNKGNCALWVLLHKKHISYNLWNSLKDGAWMWYSCVSGCHIH